MQRVSNAERASSLVVDTKKAYKQAIADRYVDEREERAIDSLFAALETIARFVMLSQQAGLQEVRTGGIQPNLRAEFNACKRDVDALFGLQNKAPTRLHAVDAERDELPYAA